MKPFEGFPSGKSRLIPIPSAFFTEIVPQVDDINVLKILLHFFRSLDHQDGPVRFVRLTDLIQDESLLTGIVSPQGDKTKVLLNVLDIAVENGYILKSAVKSGNNEVVFFLNTTRGRTAMAAHQAGQWSPENNGSYNSLPSTQPGLFQLYEENIGPITPMIADLLEEAEKNYPLAIIQYAFEEAVKQNARSWKYIDAILRNWQEKGSHGKNSRDPEKDRRKYIEGEYAEFINHE
jgi:DNA replication protein